MPRTATETTTKRATKSANAKTTKTAEEKTKTKRAPSAYNIFMGLHLKKWREENPGAPVKEGMAAVAAQWRESDENPKRGQPPAAKKAPAKKAGKENTKKSKKEVASEEEGDDSE